MAIQDDPLEKALEHHRDGRFREAADGYREILRINPEQADALYLFGCLAQQTGNYSQSVELIRRAVTAAPGHAEYHHALGLALSASQNYAEAVASYEHALAIDPRHLAALLALGDALLHLGEHGQAAKTFHRATQISPKSARAWYGLGCTQNDLEDFAVARDCFLRAVTLEPDWFEARHNLGRALYELGRVSQAHVEFQRCAETDADGSAQSRAMLAVIVPGVPEVNNAAILQTRKSWAERDLPNIAQARGALLSKGRRRIGYVSSFFHRDNWMKPIWGLINQHDREKVEVHLFSDCSASAIYHGYEPRTEDRFFDTSGLSNDEIAALVKESEIDLLVDLNGYSNMRRLPMFARRLATVVVGWFNMYATSGIAGFDYLIGDSEVAPPSEDQFYSEEILRVRGSYLTFDVRYPVPPVAARAVDEPVMFGALASQYKITDQVIEAWCRILLEASGSRLLIKNKRLKSQSICEDLVSRFYKCGIESGRLQLEGPDEHFNFLRAYERVDIALDTFPYNGGTTTTEAIWQGVPVVTFQGDRWASRTSASILRAGGLGEFVAQDLEGYVALAISLAGDSTHVRVLRSSMRERLMASAVCDVRGFARQMEDIYEKCLSGGVHGS